MNPISLKSKVWCSVFVLLLVCLTPDISFAAEAGAMDDVMKTYQSVTANFYTNIQSKAIYLLFGLVGVNLAWGASQLVIEGAVFEKIIKLLFQTAFFPALYVVFITKGAVWLNSFIEGATLFGQLGTGKVLDLNPSAIFDMGIYLQNSMIANFNDIAGADSLAGALKNFLPSLLLTAVCLTIIIAFGAMAATVFLIHVEAYILIAIAPILFAMGGSRWTKDIATKPWNSMIAVAIKLMMVYLIMSVGVTLAPLWAQMAASWTITDWSPIWKIAFGAATLAFLTVKIPQMAANALSGTSSLSAGDALNMATSAAVAAVGATAMAYGAAEKTLDKGLDLADKGLGKLGSMSNGLGLGSGNNNSNSVAVPDPTGPSPSNTAKGNADNASISGANSQKSLETMFSEFSQKMNPPKTTNQKLKDGLRGFQSVIPNDQASVGGDNIRSKNDD